MNFANMPGFAHRWKLPAVLFGALIVVSLALTVPLILDDQAGMAQRSGREMQLTAVVDDNPAVSNAAVQLRARQNHGWATADQHQSGSTVSAAAIQLRARNLHGETLNTNDPSTTGIGRFVSE